MSSHSLGTHTREINVKALRAWIEAGRPGSLREWAHPPATRAPRAQRQRWPWWPTVLTVAAVLTFMAAFSIGSTILEDPPERQHVARWCVSCHAGSTTQGELP